MKIAVPVAEGRLTPHFGHAAEFAIVHVEDGQVDKKELLKPPPHEPGVLPQWLHNLGVEVIIAGGMGPKALGFFEQYGIQVATGVSGSVQEVLQLYLSGQIHGASPCMDHEVDHDSHEHTQDESSELQEEIRTLRKQLDLAMERLQRLEQEKK